MGFLIHDHRDIDYYLNIVRHFEPGVYTFIVADLGGEDKFVQKVIENLIEINQSYILMSSVKKKNLLFRLLVTVKMREKSLTQILFNKLIAYPYRNTIGAFLSDSKYDYYLRKTFGIGFTFGGRVKWCEISYINNYHSFLTLVFLNPQFQALILTMPLRRL